VYNIYSLTATATAVHRVDFISGEIFQKLVNAIYAEKFTKLPHTLWLNP
jgi:hypothetical protein